MKRITFSIFIYCLLTKSVFMTPYASSCYPQQSAGGDVKCTTEILDDKNKLNTRCCSGDAWINAAYFDSNPQFGSKFSVKTFQQVKKSITLYLKKFKIKPEEEEEWKKIATCIKNHVRFTFGDNGQKVISFYLPHVGNNIMRKIKEEIVRFQKVNATNDDEIENEISVTVTKYGRRCFVVSDNEEYVADPKAFKEKLIINGFGVSLDKHYQNVYQDLKREIMFELNEKP